MMHQMRLQARQRRSAACRADRQPRRSGRRRARSSANVVQACILLPQVKPALGLPTGERNALGADDSSDAIRRLPLYIMCIIGHAGQVGSARNPCRDCVGFRSCDPWFTCTLQPVCGLSAACRGVITPTSSARFRPRVLNLGHNPHIGCEGRCQEQRPGAAPAAVPAAVPSAGSGPGCASSTSSATE